MGHTDGRFKLEFPAACTNRNYEFRKVHDPEPSIPNIRTPHPLCSGKFDDPMPIAWIKPTSGLGLGLEICMGTQGQFHRRLRHSYLQP